MKSQSWVIDPALYTLFSGLLICYLFGQSWYPSIERYFFWGEGIAFLMLFSFWKANYQNILQKRIILGVYGWIFLLSAYGILSSYFLWSEQVVFYHLLRHLAFFYYALFFFAGYQWGPRVIQMLSRYWFIPLSLLVISNARLGFGGGLGSSMLAGFIFLVCQKGNPKRLLFYFMLLGMAFVWFMLPNSTAKLTGLLLVSSLFFVYFMRLWNRTYYAQLNKFFVRFFLLIGLVFLVYGFIRLKDLIYAVAAAGGSFQVFQEDFTFTDMNGVWRIMLWTYLSDRFVHNLFGVGLGTPLVGTELSDFMYLIQKPEDLYTSGAHNSFITFLVRLGVPFLLYFIYMAFYTGKLIISFLKKTNYQVLNTADKRFVFSSILVFLIGVILTTFNVVLESPIAAGVFWFNFGLFVRVVGDFIAHDKIQTA